MGTLGRQQRQTCRKDTISVNKKGVNENKTCRMMDALGRQQRQTCRQDTISVNNEKRSTKAKRVAWTP